MGSLPGCALRYPHCGRSALPVLVGLWTSRIWLLAHRGELNDDPVAFAVRDRVSLALGAGMVLALGMAILVPPLGG